ncbi:hypothetical protein SKAU_G00006070 [Synaphobranchus kaupii]|uniref:Uncharacterized protein n=1 Tax=Synaphobranchus kaupii TaxID=118154 RepID=A0A9Q1JD20_SYNKA|nr:hypothetical protein SKAU_G00006070 [Synaphobranchus kaupii]
MREVDADLASPPSPPFCRSLVRVTACQFHLVEACQSGVSLLKRTFLSRRRGSSLSSACRCRCEAESDDRLLHSRRGSAFVLLTPARLPKSAGRCDESSGYRGWAVQSDAA